MAFEFSVLSSGSKANSLFFTDGKTRLLVDCGLSAREAGRRLSALGIDPGSIDAILISHEHSDHIRGVGTFCKKYHTAVFASGPTARAWSEQCEGLDFPVHEFEAGNQFSIGEIQVSPFQVSHDAVDPVMFRLSSRDRSLGVLTDLGQVTELVREKISGVDALVLETNHDPYLLQESSYPWEVKQRIKGRSGHLSNEQASTLVKELTDSLRLRILIGAHISENSNHPGLVMESLRNAVGESDVRCLIAGVKESTEMLVVS